MIDDKKIEEAATIASISDTEKGHVKNGYVVSALADHENGYREGYIEGAKWAVNEFLKDLWYPVSKEPEKFRKILYTGGSIDTTDTTMLITNNSWNTKVCLLEIKKWCYIDDLLPKKGGEK